MKPTISTPRLPWSMIKESFAGEWVELVEFAWKWDRPTPTWACIRHHDSDRKELMRKITRSGEVEESIVLFVGAAEVALACGQESAAL